MASVGYSPALRRRHEHARSLAYDAAHQANSPAVTRTTGEALAGHEGEVIRFRAAHAARNSPEISAGVMAWKHEIRGPARAQPDSTKAQEAWDRWSAACGYRHQAGSLGQQVGRAIAVVLQGGRAWIQRIQVAPSAYSANGLLLLVRTHEELDRGRGEHGLAYDQGAVMAGAYFRPPPLARGNWYRNGGFETVYVDARDLIELRLSDVTDTDDGEPISHAALTSDKIMGELAVAELRSKQVAANITGIAHTKSPSLTGRPFPGAITPTATTAEPLVSSADGQPANRLSPGSMFIVRGVDGLEMPRTDQGAIDFKTHRARVAAAMGHTIQTVGGDTGEASMSALLHATASLHRRAGDLGIDAGVREMWARILQWFLVAELLAGRNWYRENWDWMTRSPISIQPVRDIEALELEVANGFESRVGAMRRLGRDPRTVDREREADGAVAA